MKDKIIKKIKTGIGYIKANITSLEWWKTVLRKMGIFLIGIVLGEIVGYIKCGKETTKFFDEHYYTDDDGEAFDVHFNCFKKQDSYVKRHNPKD